MIARIEERMEGTRTVVTIAGWLGANHANSLRERCLLLKGALTLDLSGLVSADTQGILALRELEADGARIVGSSAFVRMLISGEEQGA